MFLRLLNEDAILFIIDYLAVPDILALRQVTYSIALHTEYIQILNLCFSILRIISYLQSLQIR